ncbi:hypothetical protein [Mycobacterium sp. SMC-4]|uniref:hypothetical protein n=1 Tax=Mycobacterium sp. SMC-4 TaxID=2857059 RepID=UPI003D01253B
MWTEAAKRLRAFDDAVLTAVDEHGYPISVRVPTRDYDAATGELPAQLPATLAAAEGPANLLCHSHDDKLWNLQTAHVKGHLVRRGQNWVFVSETYTPQSRWHMVSFLKNANDSAQRYLERRGLTRPAVNWATIRELRRRAETQDR